MKRTGDQFILTSGRTFDANRGLISLRRNDGGGFTVSEGYDGQIDVAGDWCDEGPWTADERRELADYMIALWSEFKAAKPIGEPTP